MSCLYITCVYGAINIPPSQVLGEVRRGEGTNGAHVFVSLELVLILPLDRSEMLSAVGLCRKISAQLTSCFHSELPVLAGIMPLGPFAKG